MRLKEVNMQQHFKVTGMTCAACSAGIQKTVGKMKGVDRAEVSLMGESMIVSYDEKLVRVQDILRTVTELGYGIFPDDEAAEPERKPASQFDEEAKKLRTRFFVSLCFLVPLLYFTMAHMFGAPLPYFFEEPV